MGKQSNSKDLRRQIRNVLQEEAKTIAASEVGAQVQKDLLEAQNKRLDQIEEFCKGQLEKQDKRARDVQGFLVGIVKNHLQESLNDMDLTIESLVEVLTESGIVISDVQEKIRAKKPQIQARRQEAAAEAMKKEMEERAKQSQDEQQTKTEQPVEESKSAETV
jgi:small ligand-binding sensory domain FIST